MYSFVSKLLLSCLVFFLVDQNVQQYRQIEQLKILMHNTHPTSRVAYHYSKDGIKTSSQIHVKTYIYNNIYRVRERLVSIVQKIPQTLYRFVDGLSRNKASSVCAYLTTNKEHNQLKQNPFLILAQAAPIHFTPLTIKPSTEYTLTKDFVDPISNLQVVCENWALEPIITETFTGGSVLVEESSDNIHSEQREQEAFSEFEEERKSLLALQQLVRNIAQRFILNLFGLEEEKRMLAQAREALAREKEEFEAQKHIEAEKIKTEEIAMQTDFIFSEQEYIDLSDDVDNTEEILNALNESYELSHLHDEENDEIQYQQQAERDRLIQEHQAKMDILQAKEKEMEQRFKDLERAERQIEERYESYRQLIRELQAQQFSWRRERKENHEALVERELELTERKEALQEHETILKQWHSRLEQQEQAFEERRAQEWERLAEEERGLMEKSKWLEQDRIQILCNREQLNNDQKIIQSENLYLDDVYQEITQQAHILKDHQQSLLQFEDSLVESKKALCEEGIRMENEKKELDKIRELVSMTNYSSPNKRSKELREKRSKKFENYNHYSQQEDYELAAAWESSDSRNFDSETDDSLDESENYSSMLISSRGLSTEDEEVFDQKIASDYSHVRSRDASDDQSNLKYREDNIPSRISHKPMLEIDNTLRAKHIHDSQSLSIEGEKRIGSSRKDSVSTNTSELSDQKNGLFHWKQDKENVQFENVFKQSHPHKKSPRKDSVSTNYSSDKDSDLYNEEYGAYEEYGDENIQSQNQSQNIFYEKPIRKIQPQIEIVPQKYHRRQKATMFSNESDASMLYDQSLLTLWFVYC